jgi:hypothetical protein
MVSRSDGVWQALANACLATLHGVGEHDIRGQVAERAQTAQPEHPERDLPAQRQHVLDPDPQGLAQQLAGLLPPDQQHRDVGGALLQPAGHGERVVVGQGRPDQGGEDGAALGGHRRHRLVGPGHPDGPLGQPGEGVGQPGRVAVVRFDDHERHRRVLL